MELYFVFVPCGSYTADARKRLRLSEMCSCMLMYGINIVSSRKIPHRRYIGISEKSMHKIRTDRSGTENSNSTSPAGLVYYKKDIRLDVL